MKHKVGTNIFISALWAFVEKRKQDLLRVNNNKSETAIDEMYLYLGTRSWVG